MVRLVVGWRVIFIFIVWYFFFIVLVNCLILLILFNVVSFSVLGYCEKFEVKCDFFVILVKWWWGLFDIDNGMVCGVVFVSDCKVLWFFVIVGIFIFDSCVIKVFM